MSLQPVEGAAVDDHAADRIAVAAEEFGERVHDDVGAVFDRLAQIGRRQRVVDDQRHAGLLARSWTIASMSVMTPPGLAIDSMKIALVFGDHRLLERGDVVGIGPDHVPAEILEGVIELVDRAAVELLRRDEFVARRHQRVHHDHLRGVAGGDREAGRAAFERGDALFQHRVGRVADARIDVAEGLQAEQRGRVFDVVEHERGRLIDRRGPRAGGRIGLRAGVDGERVEARCAVGWGFGHGCPSSLPWRPMPAPDDAGLIRRRAAASRQTRVVAMFELGCLSRSAPYRLRQSCRPDRSCD